MMPVVLVAAMSAGCNVPLGLAFGATSTPTASPTATISPTPTPEPTPLPLVCMRAGERALFYGDWDTALAEYQTARTGAATAEERGDAQLGLGVALASAGRWQESFDALGVFLVDYPDHAERARGFFHRAQAAEELGLLDQALQDYAAYLALRPGRIDAYVNERSGDLFRQAGRPVEAVPAYQAALSAPGLLSALGLEFKIGQAYLEAGEPGAAFERFDRVYQIATDGATRATANLLAGLALEAQGDVQGAYGRYLDSVNRFPEAYDAYTGLVRLVDAGVPVDDFQRGLVDYHAGAHEPALAAFERVLAVGPNTDAFYYRGLTRQALGDGAGAVSDFAAVVAGGAEAPHWTDAFLEQAYTEWAYLDRYGDAIQTYLDYAALAPASASADDALFAAARVAERSGDLAGAAALWLRVPAEYAASELAWQSAFEAGIVRFRLADFVGAREAFQLADAIGAEPGDHAAARLWIGKTRMAEGDAVGTVAEWQAAAAADPTGYYAARADDLLAGGGLFDPRGVFDFTIDLEAERLEAETWLRQRFPIVGPEPLAGLSPQLSADPRLVSGLELWALGRFDDARAELDDLRQSLVADAESTYRLMHTLLDLGLYRPAILAARQILELAGMDDAATMSAPVYFNHIRFGPYFGDLILPAALAEGFDGLFLLSVVRQESLFEGFAVSSASARGLMQVIPSTGQAIADALAWPPDYTTPDLYRPVVSVRFGAHYLAEQRDLFGGDLFAALAAYNAGPGNAEIWESLAPDDPDLFLEVIRLQEPHLYIRRIYEIFAIYRRLYVRP